MEPTVDPVHRETSNFLWLKPEVDLRNVTNGEEKFNLYKTQEMMEVYPMTFDLVTLRELTCNFCKKKIGVEFNNYRECSDDLLKKPPTELKVRLNKDSSSSFTNKKKNLEYLLKAMEELSPSDYYSLQFQDYFTKDEVFCHEPYTNNVANQRLLAFFLHSTITGLYDGLRRELIRLAEVVKRLKKRGEKSPYWERARKVFEESKLKFDMAGLQLVKERTSSKCWERVQEKFQLLDCEQHQEWFTAIYCLRNSISHLSSQNDYEERLLLRLFVRYSFDGDLLATKTQLTAAWTTLTQEQAAQTPCYSHI